MNKLIEMLNIVDAEAENLCALAKRLQIQGSQHAGTQAYLFAIRGQGYSII